MGGTLVENAHPHTTLVTGILVARVGDRDAAETCDLT
jgi:hypothetical protein